MKKQFFIGQEFTEGGIEYRIRPGNRKEGDFVVQFRAGGGDWTTSPISHIIILTAAKGQVEENNYGDRGGVGKLLKALMWGLYDWPAVVEEIREEAELAAWKRNGGCPG